MRPFATKLAGSIMVTAACFIGLWISLPDLLYALEGDKPGPLCPALEIHSRAGRYVRVLWPVDARIGTAELDGDKRDIILLRTQPLVVLVPHGREVGYVLDVTGRLLRGDLARGWSSVADDLARRLNLHPSQVMVLVEGEAPSIPWGSLGLSLLLVVLLWLSVRRWRRV